MSRRDDAEDAVSDAVVESIATGTTVELAWSRDVLDALDLRTDVDDVHSIGACEAEATGTDDEGRPWVLYLYNATEGD